MPRQARIKDNYGTFYIYQKANSERLLFNDDSERNIFLKILSNSQKQFNFLLYAYCIRADDEYHLVIDVNGGDLSKIMKSINISYAMKINCIGKLFKDRFKSTLLNSESDKQQIISMIHDRYTDNSIWNSYCVYHGLNPININTTNESNDCKNCLNSIDEANDKLAEIAYSSNQSINEVLKNKIYRNELIKQFRNHSTLSLRELGVVFGGLSESSISKILKN